MIDLLYKTEKLVFCSLSANFLFNESFQSLMIEINSWLYLEEDYSVDSERTKTLVSVLGRVAEGLKDN